MLKLQFVQFVPGRRARSEPAAAAGVPSLANGRYWQTATFRVAQRMLRKLEQNIFPKAWRQVDAVANNAGRIFALEGQMGGPFVKGKDESERLEAADTIALQGQLQLALNQQSAFELLDLQLVLERLAEPDHFIPRIDVEFRNRQLAFQANRVRFQMAQIDEQWHSSSP
jgi:hypothetical protein